VAEPAIEVRDLTKQFERRPERGMKALLHWGKPKELLTAVDHISLDVQRGELFGLLGPNAAGKTTLVKLLATLLLPTSGTARVGGLDVATQADAVRRKVGVVLGGERALYWRLTARENLWYFSQLYNMPGEHAKPRIQELLDMVGLGDRADERVEAYSKGMKQRLHIARGLLNEPEVLLLDEPTIGLDPHAARTLRALVREVVKDRGHTVVLTTHYMYEADALSDRVAVMHHGKIVVCDTPAALKARFAVNPAFRVEVRADGAGPGDLRAALAATPGVAHVVEGPADLARGIASYRVLAEAKESPDLPGALAQAVANSKARLVALAREEPTLEDVFVDLTGEGLTDEGASPVDSKRRRRA